MAIWVRLCPAKHYRIRRIEQQGQPTRTIFITLPLTSLGVFYLRGFVTTHGHFCLWVLSRMTRHTLRFWPNSSVLLGLVKRCDWLMCAALLSSPTAAAAGNDGPVHIRFATESRNCGLQASEHDSYRFWTRSLSSSYGLTYQYAMVLVNSKIRGVSRGPDSGGGSAVSTKGTRDISNVPTYTGNKQVSSVMIYARP